MESTVLIVEDELDLLGLFQTILQRRTPQVEVKTAHGGQAALLFLQENAPDLVTIDLAMPQISGNDVIHYIASQPRLDKTIVVVVTAVPTRLDPVSRQRIAALLTKPITPVELKQALTPYLNRVECR